MQQPAHQNTDQGEGDQGYWIQPLFREVIGLITRVMLLGSGMAFLLGVLFIGVSYIPTFPSGVPTDLTRIMGEGLVTATIVTGLVSFLVTQYPEKIQATFNKIFEQRVQTNQTKLHEDIRVRLENLNTLIPEDLRDRLERLNTLVKESITIPASMNVLNHEGISRVYGKRADAVEDMIQDLRDQVTEMRDSNSLEDDTQTNEPSQETPYQIRIMGISLGGLITNHDPDLHKVWGEIEEYVKQGVDQASSGLNIRILIIDPVCLGARLREWWEGELTLTNSSLPEDVKRTVTTLRNFQESVAAFHATNVSFEARLYRLPPQLFLLSTSKVSYVEPYYFWKRQPPKDMPLFRLADRESLLREGMNDHFDLIWEKASVPVEQFYVEDQVGPQLQIELGSQLQVGLDKGMYESGAVNVYDNTTVTRERMLQLLQNAKKRVYIQGISLNSTLGTENQPDDLIPIITNLVEREIEVKILLLDPECEQARFRAFRECYLHEPQPTITFAEYQQSPHHREQLYKDTNGTIDRLIRLQGRVKSDKLGVRKYDAAPCCFIFLVDDCVLVAQYMYGTVTRDKSKEVGPPILGNEMPLVEYVSQPRDVYKAKPDKCVFKMMVDHFTFVYEHYACPVESAVTAPDNVKQPSSV